MSNMWGIAQPRCAYLETLISISHPFRCGKCSLFSNHYYVHLFNYYQWKQQKHNYPTKKVLSL